MEFLFVDRISNGRVICENSSGKEIILDVKNTEENVKEGDVLILKEDGQAILDPCETHKRKEKILKLREKLKEIN